MTTKKSTSKTQFINITLTQFHAHLRAELENNKIESDKTHVSFSLDHDAETGESKPSFFVSVITAKEEGHFGTGSLPFIAIDECIAKIQLEREKIVLNMQTKLTPTIDGEEIKEFTTSDGKTIKTGIRFYLKLREKFENITGLTAEQALQEISNMLI